MNKKNYIPDTCYGMLKQQQCVSSVDEIVEQVRAVGYAVLDAGYSSETLREISSEFEETRVNYVKQHGAPVLSGLNEMHTIRSPLTHGGELFTDLIFNAQLMKVLKQLISGKFILNQQNGIINPPKEEYNQGMWHRDLPYQHFISTTPLAINALFCVDDFTKENGATFVLPASHKLSDFPSWAYVEKNALQIEAPAGSFILLDCMLFHSGGRNTSLLERRAINHVYNIPYFKQQINIPMNMLGVDLSPERREILGFNFTESASISDYFSSKLKSKP